MSLQAKKHQEIIKKTGDRAISERQNEGLSNLQFVDNRPENLTQLSIQKMANESSQVNQTARFQTTMNNASNLESPIQNANLQYNSGPFDTIQRVPRHAKVVWGITHVVKEIGESILGENDYLEGEIGKEGELTSGQMIIVDDEDIFVSRRGANQEDSVRRKADKDSKMPSHEWYRVLFINAEDVRAKSVYVREGTFELLSEEIPLPGEEMVELGAGPMGSAKAFWMNQKNTAFTEFRSKEDLTKEYEDLFSGNLEQVHEMDPENLQNNVIAFGIDATQEGPFEVLPLTKNLRFTNPNIGNQDVRPIINHFMEGIFGMKNPLDCENAYEFRSMGLVFVLSLNRFKKYYRENQKQLKEPNVRIKRMGAFVTSTTTAISECRNIKMVYDFLWNAPEKITPGGLAQVIVSTNYVEQRWPLLLMAQEMGYKVIREDNYELGFDNIKTQEKEKVKKKKKAKKTLLTLIPPWGGEMTKHGVVAYFSGKTKSGSKGFNLVAKVLLDQ